MRAIISKQLLSPEEEIRLQCENGQFEKAFSGIVGLYSERIYWHVRPMTESHEDADDLVQEIFIKIWAALPSFRWESQLFTWIYRIATNEALNALRRRKVRAALQFRSLSDVHDVSDDPFFNGDEAQNKLLRAISGLPSRQRSVFCMRYFEDMKYEDISEILGTSPGSLKASYHIAAEKLKALLLS
ncbi:MAG: RNA polymerase sigma factor [Bacteroidales bacterium]|nr:RNA polymerase sigma factor [Bacteroidales bacterium]